MTAPVTPTGTPFAPPATGKAKGQKANGAQSEPVFASLLAAMAAPSGQVQTPVSIFPVGEGTEQPGAAPPGTPVANGLPAGLQAAWTVVQGTPAATNAQAPSFAQTLADAAAGTVVTGELPEASAEPPAPVLTTAPVPLPGQATPPTAERPTEPIDQTLLSSGGALPLPDEGEEEVAPVGASPVEGEAEAPGRPDKVAQERNPMVNDPSLTQGLDRAAEVSKALETPNADKFPLANRPQPDQQAEPGAELPVADVEAEPAPPLPSQGTQPALPPTVGQAQPELPVEQARPLSQLSGRYEPGPLIDQLARAVSNLDDGQYSVTLRLHPEQLGDVRLQIHMSGREVHAALEVANQDARQLLENRSDQLRQNLSQAGLTLSGFEVSTGQHRQSLRDRREALAEALAGGSRRIQQVDAPTRTAVNRIRTTDRRGGRLDTMA